MFQLISVDAHLQTIQILLITICYLYISKRVLHVWALQLFILLN